MFYSPHFSLDRQLSFQVDISEVEAQRRDGYSRKHEERNKDNNDAHVRDHLNRDICQHHGGISNGTIHDAYILRASRNDSCSRSLIQPPINASGPASANERETDLRVLVSTESTNALLITLDALMLPET